VRGRRVHTGDAELLPHLGERHLQVLEHPDEPLHRADVLAHRCDAAGDLPGIQRIVDPPVRRQRAAQRLGNTLGRLAGNQRKLHAGQPGGGLGEPRRRVEQVGRGKGDNRHSRSQPGRC